MSEKIFTLDDYCDQVLRPTVLNAIQNGRCDNAVFEHEMDDIFKDDPELMKAITARRKAVAQ